jgi:hypothetical protein
MRLGVAAFAFSVAIAGLAQTPLADSFLKPYGLDGFTPLYREALQVFLAAEPAYEKGDYAEASRLVEGLWRQHPPGTDEWAEAYRDAHEMGRTKGVNLGCPSCYYALRMLTDCVRWRMDGGRESQEESTATLSIVLVGHGKGTQPTSKADLAANKGAAASLDLDPLLLKDGNRVIHQSLWLFREYMLAATQGRLKVATRIVYLKDLTVPVHVDGVFAGLAEGAWSRIWDAVGEQVKATTDWWWVLYPSNVPEQYPDFKTAEFITGGMGVGPDGGSPCFIIDDRWLTRKPPHLGKGPYTDVERRAYLPQWLQHEFFHHLFRIYPQFGLEKKGHDWFDRKTWPADFEGKIEPDYYHEALHKCIQPRGDPPLHVALLCKPPPALLFRSLSADAVLGDYRHEPVENDWHIGTIRTDAGGGLLWRNKAGVSWKLTADLPHGLLKTGPDCPYFETGGSAFQLVLKRDLEGRWLPVLAGYRFGGAFYSKVEK